MRFGRTFLVSVALVFVALGLGVSIGYSASPITTRTTTLIETRTLPTTVIQTVPTTITVTSLGQSGVETVTQKVVVVYVYIPECVTISGQTSTTYVSPVGGQTTTITYIYPANVSGTVTSFTTVTNNTATFSNRTQFESISC